MSSDRLSTLPTLAEQAERETTTENVKFNVPLLQVRQYSCSIGRQMPSRPLGSRRGSRVSTYRTGRRSRHILVVVVDV
jgi:hypothetical protein